MRPIHSTGRRRAVLIGAVLAICLALPAAASAATPGGGTAQVTIGTSVHVAAKVAAVVDVSFTCDPFLVMDPATGTLVESTIGHLADGGVTLTQASGKSVAVASASFDNATVVCDGVTRHTESMVSHGNDGAVEVGGGRRDRARVQVFSDGFESRDVGESGPVVVKLGK